MRYLFLLLLLCATMFSQAQVGIGTNTPSNNSVLDVTSTNKGIMLPRINDTTDVANPSAGLFIYNLHTNKPTFHNGTAWNALSAETSAASGDSVTYTITNAGGGFTNGTYKLLSVSQGISNPGSGSYGSFSDISFTVESDINSTGFARLAANGNTMGADIMAIEIKFFTPGSGTPYYSIKGTNLKVTSFQLSGASGFSSGVLFGVSITPVIFGYKDWINNVSFAWNNSSHTVTTY